VVAGRSLREVEEGSMVFLQICAFACFVTLIASAAVTAFMIFLNEKKKNWR
jgi:F0F1-type ATP synthase membrane subunit b/b'